MMACLSSTKTHAENLFCCRNSYCLPTADDGDTKIPANLRKAFYISLFVCVVLAALTAVSSFTNFTTPGANPIQGGLTATATQWFLAATIFSALITAAIYACKHRADKIMTPVLHNRNDNIGGSGGISNTNPPPHNS